MSVPGSLQDIIETFSSAPASLRLPLLLEYAGKVNALPDGLDSQTGMERVHECQTPFFLASELDADGRVKFLFDAPEESPTTRGFAGILQEGLQGLSPQEVLAVPDDFYMQLGLAELISPLRLRGIGAILARAKRQIADLRG